MRYSHGWTKMYNSNDRTLNFNSFLYEVALDCPGGVEEKDREIQVEGRGQKELKLWPWSGFSLSTQMQSSSQNRCYDVH